MWVKEIRNLTQQFQFGLLQARSKNHKSSFLYSDFIKNIDIKRMFLNVEKNKCWLS